MVDDYYVDPITKASLNKAKKDVLENDADRVYLIDGAEGAGKSVLGMQLACYFDPDFDPKRGMVYSGTKFAKAIDEAKKGEAIIFDEAFNGLSSGGASSKLNRLIVKKLMECRQKNLFIFIILPTLFELQRYPAIYRSSALFHVYRTKTGVRGYYKVYNKENKKMLHIQGKKNLDYRFPRIFKSYRFYNKYPPQVNEEEYRKNKLAALQEDLDEGNKDKYYGKFMLMSRLLKDKYKCTFIEMSEYLKEHKDPMESTSISRGVAKTRQNA